MRILTTSISLILLIALTVSCSTPDSFESNMIYISEQDSARTYHFVTQGTLESGADMAESYQGQLLIQDGTETYTIHFKAEQFTPTVTEFQSSNGLTGYEIDQPIDPPFFARLLAEMDPSLSSMDAQNEATDLFESLKFAGMGPKVGAPAFESLRLQSEEHRYHH